MTETREQRTERLYAEAERSLDVVKARRVRRGPETLIGVLVLLSLGVGVVAAVDLRRLMTPRGTALAWTGAAVFGDCAGYERLSVPPRTALRDSRAPAERCLALRRATQEAREQSGRVGIDLLQVGESERDARAVVRLSRPQGVVVVQLELVREGAGWAVVRTDATCRVVGCA
ncbi:MAG: hypothetical protein H7323_10785 [Frankiales bacterium]|nr:hypothetical protein [Frankiales bacterium]